MTENPAELVKVTIDGITVEVEPGTLVIRAAEQAGIEIPRFCDHPLLKPVGACRQCLVDIAVPDREGNLKMMPKLQTACTQPVVPNSEVYTQATSEHAAQAQEGIMEFLLINHPLDCPVCDKGGECPLQNQALTHGQDHTRFDGVKRTFPKPARLSAQILLDRDRCILCQRCTRFASEIAGDAFIALQGRGGGHPGIEISGLHGSQIGRFDESTLQFTGREGVVPEPRDYLDVSGPSGGPGVEHGLAVGPVTVGELDVSGRPFSSYFSGNTIQICPVGALTSAKYRFRSRPFDLVSVDSVAEHDSSGAAIRVDHRYGQVLRRMSGNDPQVNEEWITDVDRFAFTWQNMPDRLTMPMVRDDSGQLVATSWSEALDVAARGLESAKIAGGVAVLPGGRVTLEDALAYSAFARRVLSTNDIDARTRIGSAEELEFVAQFAGRGLGVTFADLEVAPQVLLVELDPEEEAGNVFLRLRKGVLKGHKVATIATHSTRGSIKLKAELIPAIPGGEAAVIADLPESLVEALSAPGSVIVVGERAAIGAGTLSAVVELSKRTGAKIAWVPRRAGERTAVEAGAWPNLLPGGRPVTDAAARADATLVWPGASIPEQTGRDTTAIIQALASGELGGVVVGGVHLADLPDVELARQAFAGSFVVSLEVRESEITQVADVVLPVAPTSEKPGTFVNWEGRLRPFPQVLVSHSQPDRRILNLLGKEMGVDLELDQLKDAVEQFQSFGPWDGARAPFTPVAAGAAAQAGDGEAILDTYKLMIDEGRLMEGEPHLAGQARRPVARMCAQTATELGVDVHRIGMTSDMVTVTGPKGSITLALTITEMAPGVVWLPQYSRGSHVYEMLGARAGSVVRVSREVTE